MLLKTKIEFKYQIIAKRDLSFVYHVGTFTKQKKQYSLEGAGISVSKDPSAWQRIARLSGDLWKLEKKNPKWFFAHDHLDKAMKWCLANGWLVKSTKWLVPQYDEEGEESFLQFDTEEEALKEADDPSEVKEQSDAASFDLKGIKYWKATYTTKVNDSFGESLAPVFYAEAHGFDGVWWEDVYAPNAYSAPRGVIFTSKMSSWKKTKLDDALHVDESEDF